MTIYKGNNQINKLYLGTTEINKVYLGDKLILGSSNENENTSVLYLKDGVIYLKAGVYKKYDYETDSLADITLPQDTECFLIYQIIMKALMVQHLRLLQIVL